VLVSSLTPEDATTTLFFRNLGGRAPIEIAPAGGGRLRFLGPGAARSYAIALAGASAVVVVRGLFEFDRVAANARRFKVPRYYFVDDNFIVLRGDAGVADARWFKNYSIDRVRQALKGFAGVLLATPSLVDYFREHRLHERTMLYPPVAPNQSRHVPSGAGGPLTVGFFGGLHRREPFLTYAYPAIRRLARTRPVRLVVAGIDRRDLGDSAGLSIEALEYNQSYDDGLRAMADRRIDVLAHPGTFHVHNVFKNTHVLINAHALQAVPVFSAGPPYDAISGEEVALVCGNTEEQWLAAFARLGDDEGLRQTMLARLAEYCAANFSGRENLEVISTMLREHSPPGPALRQMRALVGVPLQALGLAQHVLMRALARTRAGG
jgi:hypothetical protein